jgi:hypothetical protein
MDGTHSVQKRREKDGSFILKKSFEKMEEEENAQAVRQDVGKMESPWAQPPPGIIKNAGKRYERPVIAASDHALIFQLKTRLRKKHRDIAPAPDEMVVDDQYIVIPDEVVCQRVHVDERNEEQEEEIRRGRTCYAFGFHELPLKPKACIIDATKDFMTAAAPCQL